MLKKATIDYPGIVTGTGILLRRITFSVVVLRYLTTNYELICAISVYHGSEQCFSRALVG